MYTLRVKVKSVKGECAAGCQVGDSFLVQDPLIKVERKDSLFLYALSAMLPYITARYRMTPAGDWINIVEDLQCPDATNTVIFTLERLAG
ncbi:MAG: TIGR04076 family protein [Bacillota bacterium]